MSRPITAWSYSRWALHEQCPLKYKLKHIDKVPEPGSAAMERGDKIHKGTAAYLDGKAPELPAEAAKHFGGFIAELKAFPDKVVEQQMGFTSGGAPTGWFGSDTWLRVIWDAGVLYEDLTGEVIDWKTGKKYGSNQDQMELFALSFFWKYKPATHVSTRLVYLDSGEEQFAEFSKAADFDRLSRSWTRRGHELLGAEHFPPRPNDKCKWCAYARSAGGQCRFG